MPAKKLPKHDKKLEVPLVKPEDIAKAKKAMENQEIKKRMNSNMHYFLKGEGTSDIFYNLSATEKKDFFLKYMAKKLQEGEVEETASRKLITSTERMRGYAWMGKAAMISEFGDHKANAKIASGRLATRADPDTGLTGEWDIEYKVFSDEGKKYERDDNTRELASKSKIAEGEAQAAKKDFEDTAQYFAGNVPTSSVKLEEGAEAENPQAGQEEEDAADPHAKTAKSLATNAKQVLRGVGDTLVNLKVMFEQSANAKYSDELHNDIAKLIPKFKTIYNTVQALATKASKDSGPAEADDDKPATIYVVAKNLDVLYDAYNDVSRFHNRLNPPKKKSR